MPYNEDIAIRIRKLLSDYNLDIKGKMTIGITKDHLAVRVISEKYQDKRKEPFVKEMDFTGRTLKDFIYVEQEGFKTKSQLNNWVEVGIEHAKNKLMED